MGGAPAGEQPAKGAVAHCSYCCSNLASHGAPPAGRLLIALVEPETAALTNDIVSSYAAWHTPQPRGPPVLS